MSKFLLVGPFFWASNPFEPTGGQVQGAQPPIRLAIKVGFQDIDLDDRYMNVYDILIHVYMYIHIIHNTCLYILFKTFPPPSG